MSKLSYFCYQLTRRDAENGTYTLITLLLFLQCKPEERLLNRQLNRMVLSQRVDTRDDELYIRFDGASVLRTMFFTTVIRC